MERVLIADHFQAILDRGFHDLISQQTFDLLRLLFDLGVSTNMLGALKKFWALYLRTQGSQILKGIDSEKSSSIALGFKKILEFKDLTDRVSKEAFGGNEELRVA
jgi:hypothetical protein